MLDTPTRAEMRRFHTGEYRIGVGYWQRIAHIYRTPGNIPSLCGGKANRRIRQFVRGDKVCKRCLEAFRREIEAENA